MALFEKWTDYYVLKAKELHAITFPEGTFADIRERYAKRLDAISGLLLSGEYVQKLKEFLFSIPESCHYLHGDLNPTNLVTGDEDRLIDAGDAALGDAAFDFCYLSSIGAFFEKIIPDFSETHYHVSPEDIRLFYDMVIDKYYDLCTKEEREGIKEKLDILGIIYGVTTDMGSGDFIPQIRMAADALVKGSL
jgi:thiamine kinase-like enzyme